MKALLILTTVVIVLAGLCGVGLWLKARSLYKNGTPWE